MARKSQKALLVAEVDYLCRKLGRPVSSTDMHQHFVEHPERLPLLLQRMGQLLFKTSRSPEPSIVYVGLIRANAYYAPDRDPAWKNALVLHETRLAADREFFERLPDSAAVLIGTAHERVARNACAGLLVEWEPRLPLLEGWSNAWRIKKLLEESRNLAAERFVAREPTDLIGKKETIDLLQKEFAMRTGVEHALSTNRHLTPLRWPQTPLFPDRGYLFCRRQVEFYCIGKWPAGSDEGRQAAAMAACLRFGYG